MLTITTLQTATTEAGLKIKLQEKVVAGEHTTYQILDATPRTGGLLEAGLDYLRACDVFDWWVNGCPV